MGSSNALVVLRNLSVEFGNYDGKLPPIIRGHIKFVVGNPDVQFSNNHNYVFSGVDYNHVKGYVCQCGEAFFGLASALMHYTERFEQSTVSKCTNFANVSCNVSNDHGMKNVEEEADLDSKPDNNDSMEEDADLDSNSESDDSMEDDEGVYKDTTGLTKRLENKLICECIFRSFGYNLQIQYRTELGKQLGVSEGGILYLMKTLAKHKKKESPFEEMLTPEVRSNAMNIHNKVVEQLETWTPETGYVDKHVVLLCAILKSKSANFDSSFRNTCQTKLGLTSHATRAKCRKAIEDYGKMDALITKPNIQKEADILYTSICKEQRETSEDKQLIAERESRESEARLIVEGICLRKNAELSNPYIHELAKRLCVSSADVKFWYRRHLNCSEVRCRLLLTKDILQKSKDLDEKIKESIGETDLAPDTKIRQTFSEIHLVIEGIYQVYDDVNMDMVYRKFLSEKLKVIPQIVREYLNRRKKLREKQIEKPIAQLISKPILNRSKECHEYVMQKVKNMASKSKDENFIMFGKKKISKSRLVLEYLSKKHRHSQSLQLVKAYAEELGMDIYATRKCWKKMIHRIGKNTPFIYGSFITSAIREMAERVHQKAVERMEKNQNL